MINNQYNRAIAAQPQPQQQLNNQQNIFLSDNNSLLHNTPQLGEALYFHQQQQLNINPMNHIHPPHYQNSHSIMTSIGGMQQTSVNSGATAMFDPHLSRVFAASNGLQPASGSNASLVENSSIPNQSNTIIIDNFASQLPADQQQQVYRNPNQLSQHFQPTLQLQHSAVARQESRRASDNSQHLDQTDIAASSNSSQIMQLHHMPSANQPIFLSADAYGTASSSKLSAYLPFKVNSSFEMYQRQMQTPVPSGAVMPSSAVANTTSPVVLDRINICINNHYTDPNFSSPVVDTATTCTNSLTTDTPLLSSPIIPPIQHSAVIDPGLLIEPIVHGDDEINSSTSQVTSLPLAVNEPDSTTASHTPPSTPDNTSSLIVANINAIQSPSTSSTAKVDEPFKNCNSLNPKINGNTRVSSANPIPATPIKQLNEKSLKAEESLENIPENSFPMPATDLLTENMFTIGDDVFVKIDDDRLYLGTIIDSKYQKFRVRFDDSSEMWCSPREMRKFGVCNVSNTSESGERGTDDIDLGALCVACKKRDSINVEICERCGRGYHKACTTETSSGSGEWICKRCSKSMKVNPFESGCEEYEDCIAITEQRQQQLPYDMQSLHWDSKHRVNEEQIYCYCGRSGQFDYKMLQCCKCCNWYHTSCLQNFKSSMLRGDGYFVFCCAVCGTNGNEFLRRLQMNSVDFMHLVLYNLSAQKKHQQHKHHHLTKDIWPFVLSQRASSAMPEEWVELSEKDLKVCILSTLKNNVERFVCGRELKRDQDFYGLRNNGPPPSALSKSCLEICQAANEIDDRLIVETLKLKLSKRALENSKLATVGQALPITIDLDSDKDDPDGKFTSDDEIPIKLIIEKEKVKNMATIDLGRQETQKEISDNIQQSEKKSPTKAEIKSHKRKAFKLSRSYKESAEEEKRRRASTANCELSSDENSSSSRGTSLDLIIPPPKDFLGANNPFRTVATPKKSAGDKKTSLFGRSIFGGPTIRNSVVNASSLDFCSNFAALKNAGVLPNLNTTNFARAAGQPRMVRTIKRRLSAKDIMIGPNQEIRRRRTRRLSSNVEVISTTTINPISSFFPINASSSTKTVPTILRKQNFSTTLPALIPPMQISATKTETQNATTKKQTAAHGRRLRLRPQNNLPANSRRSSLSGASTSSTSSSSGNATLQTAEYSESAILSDLQKDVNRYFGVSHLISSGEQFSIHAKRQLANGQIQLLIEWGVNDESSVNADSTTSTETGEKTFSQENT